jgi:SAM-dependent methyltransferase
VFATGIPKPDGWFDYIHQRMLIGAIPKDAWEDHIKECARVCASGGWIELLEVNALLLGGGPAAEQFNRWATGGFAAVGINPTLAGELDVFLKKAGFINIRKMYYKLPCGPWGGKAGLLFARDFKLLNSSLKPLFTRAFNISDEVVDANTEEIMKEIEVHKAYADFYVYVGQKP